MHLKKKRWSNDDTELTLLALPSILWYALFCFLPMFGIIIAFKTYRVQAGRSFVYSLLVSPNAGFKNFEFILKANKLAILLRNTLLYNVVFIVLGIVVPVENLSNDDVLSVFYVVGYCQLYRLCVLKCG